MTTAFSVTGGEAETEGGIDENRYVCKWEEGKLRNFSPDALLRAQPSSRGGRLGRTVQSSMWPGEEGATEE